MNKRYVSLQEGKSDCAPAALSSIIKYYGGYMPLEDLRRITKTDKMGTNAYDIILAANSLGFDAIGKKMSLEQMKEEKNIFPLIAHIKKEGYYHFVAVYGFSKDKVIVMDPAIGFVKINKEEFKKDYLQTALLFSKVKELPIEAKENRLLKKIIKLILKDKKIIISLSVLSTIIFIMSIMQIAIYKYLLDLSIVNNVMKLILSLIVFIIIKNIIDLLRNINTIKLKTNLDINIMNEVSDDLLSLPPEYYKNKTTGEIITRVNDLDLLKDLIIDLSSNIFVNILLIVFSLILMFITNKLLFLVSIVFMFLYVLVTIFYKDTYIRRIRMITEAKGLYTKNMVESIEAVESITNLNIKEERLKVINSCYKTLTTLTKKLGIINTSEHFLKNNINDISIGLLILISVYLSSKNIINASDIMLIYMLYSYLCESIKTILNKIPEISYSLTNVEKINGILVNKKIENKTKNLKGPIKVEKLKYSNHYIDILKNINITIKDKDKVFIEGESGSGKSTLLRIIMKYKSLYEGNIYINNENLKDISTRSINNSFTYIGQHELIFSDTLENNLLLGRNIDKDKINKVKRICKIDEIIKTRKLKEDFLIEEGGFNLSGGEKQRIILARALLKESNYLVIDEALSEVDINMEKQIVKDILKEYEDKTIIYVSHKNEVKELFERIINIERSSNDKRRIN